MQDIVRSKLAELVGRFGLDLCNDARRCEALLRDVCGEHKREILALASAARDGVGAELRKSSAGVPKELIVARLSKRLHDDAGLAEDLARWAVESWAIALGMATAKEFRFPFQCPKCGAAGSIATRLAGQKTHCPKCNAGLFIADNGREVFLAPDKASAPAATLPPVAKPAMRNSAVGRHQPVAAPPAAAMAPIGATAVGDPTPIMATSLTDEQVGGLSGELVLADEPDGPTIRSVPSTPLIGPVSAAEYSAVSTSAEPLAVQRGAVTETGSNMAWGTSATTAGYGYDHRAAMSQSHRTLAMVGMCVSIAGLLLPCLGLFLAIAGVVLGGYALYSMSAARNDEGRGSAIAAIAVGGIGTAIWGLVIVSMGAGAP